MPVLRPLSVAELRNFFTPEAIHVVSYFINKAVFSQPEAKVGQDSLPFQVPKEHIEQWFVQALDAQGIGAGSYPIDIVKAQSRWGADVKMLSGKVDSEGNLQNGDSGETSLAQKFRGTGNVLDALFRDRQFEQIKTEWLDIYKEKLLAVYSEQNIDTIYYFILLRCGHKLYLVGMEVDLARLGDVIVNVARTTDSSIYLENFIPDCYGNLKIYKAKKRLELRLKPKCWRDMNHCIEFDMNLDETPISLLGYFSSGGTVDTLLTNSLNRLL